MKFPVAMAVLLWNVFLRSVKFIVDPRLKLGEG